MPSSGVRSAVGATRDSQRSVFAVPHARGGLVGCNSAHAVNVREDSIRMAPRPMAGPPADAIAVRCAQCIRGFRAGLQLASSITFPACSAIVSRQPNQAWIGSVGS